MRAAEARVLLTADQRATIALDEARAAYATLDGLPATEAGLIRQAAENLAAQAEHLYRVGESYDEAAEVLRRRLPRGMRLGRAPMAGPRPRPGRVA